MPRCNAGSRRASWLRAGQPLDDLRAVLRRSRSRVATPPAAAPCRRERTDLREAEDHPRAGAGDRGQRRPSTTPAAQARELAAAIPGATYVELHAAHLSNREQPGRFTAALLDFILGRRPVTDDAAATRRASPCGATRWAAPT